MGIKYVDVSTVNPPNVQFLVGVSVNNFMKMVDKILILITYCIGIGVYGSADRIRYVDPEQQALFAANSTTVPLPGRERRGGKKESNETETNNNPPAPEPPPTTVINEVGDPPEDLIEQIDNLKDENEDLKKDLESASRAIKSLVEERTGLREELEDLVDILDRGPGSIFKGWVYSPKLKWVYVSPSIVPYAFSQTDGWMLYEYGTDPRRIYYYNTKEWKILNEE